MEAEEFANCCNEHRRVLLFYAYTCCRDFSLAEDIVQEAFVIAVKKREHYFPEVDLKHWLIGLVRNVWFRERDKLQSKERKTKFIEENPSLLFNLDEKTSQPEAEQLVLKKCLEKLDTEDRVIIEFHFLQDLKYAEISERMQRKVSWIKSRMHRARITLLECVKFNLQRLNLADN